MARTWEQEKEYCRSRAQELMAEMDAALAGKDRGRFSAAYQTAKRYMTKRELSPYYKRFLAAITGR